VPKLRIGSRGSQLALWQANHIAARLRAYGHEVDIEIIHTTGDKITDVALAKVGTKGMFTKEIEEALAAGSVDLAVHSLKDLPTELSPGFEIAAITERQDPRDAFCSCHYSKIEDLPKNARVGTSSLRRQAQLKAIRPDLEIHALRGNVDTRLRKLESGDWDAILLAAAGLARLGLRPAHVAFLSSDVFVPAVGQAIIGVEIRRDDRRARAAIECLDHRATHVCALAERAYLRRLGASCTTPMAAHAVLDGTRLRMVALVASEDGRKVLRAEAAGAAEDAETMGRGLAESLLAQGAAEVAGLDPGRWTA